MKDIEYPKIDIDLICYDELYMLQKTYSTNIYSY